MKIKPDPDAPIAPATPQIPENVPKTAMVNNRLKTSSFKLPRDLTLGGAGLAGGRAGGGRAATAAAPASAVNKKVFTPNLNVTRNKNL